MKILIAEDDFVSRTVIQDILTPFGQCHVAVDGLEGLEAYKKSLEDNEPYDLICLDIMMPNLDGQELLKKIREIERERGIGGSDIAKIIMITALGDPQNIMTSLVRGHCEAYMVKPVLKDKLEAELKKLGMIG